MQVGGREVKRNVACHISILYRKEERKAYIYVV
jgi:hypothetical protein